jgi:peptidoglycan/LPS O-acetylase OafA/YrhL
VARSTPKPQEDVRHRSAPPVGAFAVGDARRPDLDALRVIAFGALILFHVGLVYVTWPSPVKSAWASRAAEPFLLLTAPWRLDLLFLISGAATRFLWDKSRSPGAFLRARALRLGPPLAFAAVVLVPVTAYLALAAQGRAVLDPATFWRAYMGFAPGLLPDDAPRGMLHVWFVVYLAAYTALVFTLALGLRLARPKRSAQWDGGAPAWLWLLAPAAVLIVLRRLLFDVYGDTHLFWGDWYNHARHGGMFLLGFAMAKAGGFWAAVERLRSPALLLAALAYGAYVSCYVHLVHGLDGAPPTAAAAWAERSARGVFAWWAILAALGWAQRAVRRTGPWVRYFSEAVFAYYLLHQPVLIAAWLALAPWRLPWPLEAAALIALTFAGTAAAYELVRRSGPLRPLFGLKPAAAKPSSAGALTAGRSV